MWISQHAQPDFTQKAFQDLTGIMDPLLDALMFYTPKKVTASTNIYKIRDGEISRSGAPPAIAKAICMYQSEKDLVDAVMGSNQDRLMAFGAIEKTHAQVQDYFAEWFNDYPDERQRNMMRNQNLTAEEYMAMPCDYTRAVYLCVKSGCACWLIHMPWRGDYANQLKNNFMVSSRNAGYQAMDMSSMSSDSK